ncbi:MAG: signal transduction histidine kinase [Gammaproteobacteria bacterium]|jgi:signal transduction histidine kinase
MPEVAESQLQQEKVLLEQIKTLFQSMGSLLAINVLVSASLVFGFWDVVEHRLLIIWMGLMLAMLAVRGVIYWRYQRNFKPSRLPQYRRFLVVGSGVAGLIWGAGGILLFPESNFEYQLFLLMALFGMTGGSTFSLSIYLPAYVAYVPATLLPIVVKLFTVGGSAHLSLAVVTLIYLAALTSFNIRLNRNFALSLALRFENLDLIEQLKSQTAAALKANAAKSKFLAAASHDLRQPLYSLGLFATVLDEMIAEAKPRKVVEQIRHSLNALENLFDKLLDISQLDAGVVDATKVDCQLDDLFEALARDFDGPAAAKGLTIEWPVSPPAVHSEPVLLEQIVRNLIANAIRYTDNGGVTVSALSDGDGVTIAVADSGIGMPVDATEDIFVEFYQLENSERDREKGLGLGLSIVQRSAALLGHTITVQSVPGEGSTFSVILEKAHAQGLDTRPSESVESEHAYSFTQDTLAIIIDDDASIREGAGQLLELWGCSVVTAEDEKTALEGLAELGRTPTAIVSDFRLRDSHTGIDVVNAIHARYGENIPALLMTGDIEQERLIMMESSNFEVLHKPVPPLKLRAFLEHAARESAVD